MDVLNKPPSPMANGKKSYTDYYKIRPFVRGLWSFGPLVEVAREALTGGYALKPDKEIEYARKLAGSLDSYKQMYDILDILEKGCREDIQCILTEGLAQFVKNKAFALFKEATPWTKQPIAFQFSALQGSTAAGDVAELNNLCKSCLTTYLTGKITSPHAIKNLEGTLIRLPASQKEALG